MPLNMDYVRQAANAIAQQQQQQTDGKRDIVNYKFRVGQNRGRFMPPWPGSGELAMHVWHHFGLPQVAGKKHEFCYENMFPGRGIQCPICATMRNLKARGVDCWRQNAVDIPRTNWIDRMPVDQFGQMIPLEKHPGPQLIDIKDRTFNYFINMAAQTGCDLTSLDMGYDVVINFSSNPDKQFDPGILPGQPQPLGPNPEQVKLWVSQMYDLRNILKVPNWQSPDGQKLWERLCAVARELERSYLSGQPAQAPGYSQPPVGQFPSQMPGGQPTFTQPTAQPVSAPPPQFAAPGMMGAPGQVPFSQTQQTPPPMAPPPAMQQPQLAPPPQTAYPPQMAPPPPPPYQPSQAPAPAFQSPAPPPLTPPPAAPAAVSTPPAPQPPALPQPPQPDSRPPWETGSVTQQANPPLPPAVQAPAPPQQSVMQTSQDGKPPCFGHSRTDQTVEFGNPPKRGGWSPLPAEVGYRCTMCPHEIACKEKALTTFPQDYQGLPV